MSKYELATKETLIKRLDEAERKLSILNKFKNWCVNDVKPFTTEERWKDCDMKQKLNELGLEG
jgi:hypothetical protein